MLLKNIKYFLLTLLTSFAFYTAEAIVKAIGVPYVRNYTLSEIQAGSQSWMIDVSQQGLVYFANNDGIIEFDGLNWRKYPLPGGTIVRSVKATSDGRIYAGAFNQFGYFTANEKGLLEFNCLKKLLPVDQMDFEDVWKIHEMPVGIVFQTYEQLMIYKDGKIKTIKAPGTFHFSFLVNGELYINDKHKGLYRLAGDRLVKVPGTGLLTGKLIWSILPKGDHLLIATSNEGVFEFDGLKLDEWKNPSAKILKKNQVYSGITIDASTYAFGTIQDGLLISDTSGKVIQHINLDRGLQNNTVLSMKLDQYGNLWLGLDNGIDYVEINSPLSYFSHFNSLSAGYAAILHNEYLYLGTNRGVFYTNWELFKRGDQEQTFKLVPKTEGQVWELKKIDNALFCGHNSGVFIIEGTKARLISDVQGGWTFIQPNEEKDLLICGTYTNLVKFEKRNKRWQEGAVIPGFKESSRFLANAGNNALWMTHGYKGVFKIQLDEKYDSVTQVNFYGENAGFESDKNINVCMVSGNPVFITDNGFYAYNSGADVFMPDKEMNNTFTGENIRLLEEDKDGNVWYFSVEQTGVFRLQEDGSYVKVEVPFRELKGRFIRGFQYVYPLNEKHVIFGIQDGYVHYTPDYPKKYRYAFSSFIRKVELSGIDSVLFIGHSRQHKTLPEIPFKLNELKFEFSANDFENPDDIRFSTKLEGFDKGWQAWRNIPVREFTNLHQGDYTLKVKARNIFGTESNVSAFDFYILPPWYLSWKGYIIYFLAFVALVLLMSKYVRMRMEKSKREEKERQKRIFKEREEQLQTNALKAEKEVIRLRNEKLRAEMKQKDKELANSTMQMIQKSKFLSSIKREMNKLAKEIGDDLITNHINSMKRKIDREMDTEQQWEVFEKHFENVHEEFLKRLKTEYPDLSPREMKLCAYLRLNISSKEIATLMNISTRGVEISRYRLRKKLNLNHDTNLTEFIMGF